MRGDFEETIVTLQLTLRCAALIAALLAAPDGWATTPSPGDSRTAATTLTPAQILAGREQVARQMIAQGREPAAARELASLLTEDDLLVLIENPKMMQEAGEANAQTTSLILAGLVIGGLVALLITADSGFAMQS